MANTGTSSRTNLPYQVQIALGNINGIRAFRKWGMNENIGTGTYDIWPSATVRTLPTVAGVVSVVSNSVNDTSAGTGARTVSIQGLDANYASITETVTLNGLTPVTTVQSFLRVNRALVLTAGTGRVNAGIITASIGGNAQSIIEANQGQDHDSQYTVPADKQLLILSTRFGTGRFTGSGNCHILSQVRPFGTDTAWRSIQDIYLFENNYAPPYVGGELIPPKAELRIQAISTISTQIYVEYSGWELNL